MCNSREEYFFPFNASGKIWTSKNSILLSISGGIRLSVISNIQYHKVNKLLKLSGIYNQIFNSDLVIVTKHQLLLQACSFRLTDNQTVAL